MFFIQRIQKRPRSWTFPMRVKIGGSLHCFLQTFSITDRFQCFWKLYRDTLPAPISCLDWKLRLLTAIYYFFVSISISVTYYNSACKDFLKRDILLTNSLRFANTVGSINKLVTVFAFVSASKKVTAARISHDFAPLPASKLLHHDLVPDSSMFVPRNCTSAFL